MEHRRWWSGAVIALGVIAVTWMGYSLWVSTLDEKTPDARATLQVPDYVPPESSVSVQVVAVDDDTGDPIGGEPVQIVRTDSGEILGEGQTDADGLFVAELDTPDERSSVEVQARVGSGLTTQEPSAAFEVRRDYSVLVQTDKPRYQPGQDIQIRAIARQLGAEPVDDEVHVQVEDPEGTVFFDRQIATNDYGMVHTEFPLASVAEEGTYRVSVGYEDAEQVETVRVEHYTLPQFEVGVDTHKNHYRPGEVVELQLEADYFFGEPVAGGEFSVQGAGYLGELEPFEQIEGTLDEQGAASVELQLPDYFVGAAESEDLGMATIEVEVTDGAGDTEVTVEEVLVSEDDLLVEAFPAGGALVEEAENEVWITTRTPDGRPIAATVEFTPGGSADSQTVETSEHGIGSVQFTPTDYRDRQWELHAETDRQPHTGEPGDVEREATTEMSLQENQVADLGLIVDRPAYAAGDTAALELVSSRSEATVYLEVSGNRGTHFTDTVGLEDHRASFDFDVGSAMEGSLHIQARIVGAGGAISQTAAVVPVAGADELDVELTASADEYAPGEFAEIQIETAENGQPVPASVGLDIVDESVFAVGGDDRDQLVAERFGMDRQLMEPVAWLYGYDPVGMASDPEPDPELYRPECGLAAEPIEPSTSHVDGFDDLADRLMELQGEHAERNAMVVLFFLLMIPVAMAAWLWAHRDPEGEFGPRVRAWTVGIVLIAATALALFFGALAFEDSLEMFSWAILGLLAVVTPLGIQRGDRVFLSGIAALWLFYVFVLVGAELWFDDAVDNRLLIEFDFLIVGAAAIVPLVLAMVVGTLVVKHRFVEAVAPVVMGAVFFASITIVAFDVEWFGFLGLLGVGIAAAVFCGLFSAAGAVEDTGGDEESNDDPDLITKILARGADLVLAAGIVGLVGVTAFFLFGDEFALEVIFAGAFVVVGGLTVLALVYRRFGAGSALLGGVVALFMLSSLVFCVFGEEVGRLFSEPQQEVESVAVDQGYRGGGQVVEEAHAPVDDVEEFAAEPEGEPSADASSEGGEEDEIAVREFFPETLYSDIVLTDDDGEATIDVRMADSITNWKMDAVGISSSGALGTASEDAIVFQPFFIEPQLPTSLTQGDSITVPVSVFNYSEEPLDLTVELESHDWFDADGYTEPLRLEPNEVDGVEFEVTAEENGTHQLEWIARAEGEETGESTGDAIRHDIRVEPHGRQRTDVVSGRLDGTVSESLSVPADAVEGSEMAVLQLHPGVLGQLIEGMDALLQMPTGCFEQTSSSLYPNAMALSYMEETDTANPDIRQQAERYIAQGYQRILSFEVDGETGGYSLFGDAPASHSITAYGLRMLGDIDEVYSIDDRVMDEMFDFVVDNQNRDGSWDVESRTDYVVGIDDRFGLTAFMTWSLATYDPGAAAVNQARDWVESRLNVSSASTRDLALVLNMLAALDERGDLQTEIADELVERADDDGETIRWAVDADSGTRAAGTGTAENTALATLALLESGRHIGVAQGGLNYLVESKSERGWGTTTATVAALDALTSPAGSDSETVEQGDIEVKQNGETVWSLQLDEDTAGEAHLAALELDPGANDIEIHAPADSGFDYQLETRYHEPWGEEDDEEDLRVQVDYDRTELTVDDSVEVTAAVEVREQSVGMALVEVGVPPGFEANMPSLNDAADRGEISDFETAERHVTLYVEDVDDRIETTFQIIAQQPIEASSGSSSGYDYYAPERETETGPVEFVVR